MAKIPSSHIDILEKKAFAHLATLMEDGSPQTSPVWVDHDGDRVVINSARGRVKDRNVERDRRVAISVCDPENPYRHLTIRGVVEEISEEGADAHIDAMAKRYLDVDTYPYRSPGEVRVRYYVRPDHVTAYG